LRFAGECEAFSYWCEALPTVAHGFGAWGSVITVPAAQPSDDPTDPGQRAGRMGVALAVGFALQTEAQRGRGGDLLGTCNVAGRARTAVAGIDRTAALVARAARLNNRCGSAVCPSSMHKPWVFSMRKVCSMRHRKRYSRTTSVASASLRAGIVVSSRQCSGAAPVGGLASYASTKVISIELASPSRRALRGWRSTTPPARSTTRASRPRSPGPRGV
jgi:hypothetical protein